jgi:hypothetical protein
MFPMTDIFTALSLCLVVYACHFFLNVYGQDIPSRSSVPTDRHLYDFVLVFICDRSAFFPSQIRQSQ